MTNSMKNFNLFMPLGPVPERQISANPGLNFCSSLCIYLPMYRLEQHFVLSLLYLRVKAQQHPVNLGYMFLAKKTVLTIQLA